MSKIGTRWRARAATIITVVAVIAPGMTAMPATATPSTTSAPVVTVASAQVATGDSYRPDKCPGKKKKTVYIGGYAKVRVYYSKKHGGTVCATTAHIGKYKGVKKKSERRCIGILLERALYTVSERGRFKYYAGPVAWTGAKGDKVLVEATSTKKCNDSDGRPGVSFYVQYS